MSGLCLSSICARWLDRSLSLRPLLLKRAAAEGISIPFTLSLAEQALDTLTFGIWLTREGQTERLRTKPAWSY